MERSEFIELASYVMESPFNGNACHIVSFPDHLGNVYANDLDMGVIFKTNVESIITARKLRTVEEQDWLYSWVNDDRGTEKVDEDLELAVMIAVGAV